MALGAMLKTAQSLQSVVDGLKSDGLITRQRRHGATRAKKPGWTWQLGGMTARGYATHSATASQAGRAQRPPARPVVRARKGKL